MKPKPISADQGADGKFLPGNCANPGGRPKGSISLKRILEERLRANDGEAAMEVIDATIADAVKGNVQARRLVFEYIEGRPRETIDATIDSVVRIVDDI